MQLHIKRDVDGSKRGLFCVYLQPVTAQLKHKHKLLVSTHILPDTNACCAYLGLCCLVAALGAQVC